VGKAVKARPATGVLNSAAERMLSTPSRTAAELGRWQMGETGLSPVAKECAGGKHLGRCRAPAASVPRETPSEPEKHPGCAERARSAPPATLG
jgi:hypothetical protein